MAGLKVKDTTLRTKFGHLACDFEKEGVKQKTNYLVDAGNCFSDAQDVMDGHRRRVFAAQFHKHHPSLFISGGWDNTVQVR